MIRSNFLALLILSFVTVGCNKPPSQRPLSGSGSTFVWPIMARWMPEYERLDGAKVSYKPNGSSLGVKGLMAREFDFACSDGPLGDEEMAKLQAQGEEVVHVPLVLSAVVAVYNLDEIKEPIRFTGPVLADIYLGVIKKWNDPALKTLNPTLQLPDKDITVVHRSDGSGTTYIWTDYLSKTSPEWKKKAGKNREITWPTGTGGKGNEGVAEKVKETAGAIGYIDLSDAFRKSLPFGLIQNQEKEFVRASLESVSKAAEHGTKAIPADLRYSITDASGKGSYPISGTTWAIVYRDQSKNENRQRLVGFLKWVVTDGQAFAEQLLYSRLPTDLAEKSLLAVERIKLAK